MLHAGHIRTLEAARDAAKSHFNRDPYLIVGVHNDREVERQWPGYPIMNLQERVLAVMAVRPVNNVIIDAPWVVSESFCLQLGIELVLHAPGDDDRREERFRWPKKNEIYVELYLRSEGDLSVHQLMECIWSRKENYAGQFQKKRQKEENYYKQRHSRYLSGGPAEAAVSQFKPCRNTESGTGSEPSQSLSSDASRGLPKLSMDANDNIPVLQHRATR